jgi:hypothetical protein
MYFNGEVMWQAANSDISLLSSISPKNYTDMLLSYPKYLSSVLPHALSGTAISPEGIYRSDSFNAYGDISYPREHNVMAAGYDVNSPVSLTPELFQQEFIDYLNRYIDEARKKGATVYYTFSPVNKSALTDETDSTAIEEFYKFTAESLNCPVISDLRELIMHENYFYDTNFHLNDAGALYRTITLCRDLLFATDNPTRVCEEYPEPPALAEGLIKVYEDISDEGLFIYEKLGNGNYMITGLTERGKAERELTIPLGVKPDGFDYGIAITVLGEGAFDGCSAEKIIIPENTYLTQMNNDVFRGASSVSELYIYKLDSESLNPPKSFIGTKDGFVIHAPENSEYKTGYFWSQVKNVTIILDLKTN